MQTQRQEMLGFIFTACGRAKLRGYEVDCRISPGCVRFIIEDIADPTHQIVRVVHRLEPLGKNSVFHTLTTHHPEPHTDQRQWEVDWEALVDFLENSPLPAAIPA